MMSDNTDTDPATDARLRAFLGVVAGYIAACLATVAAFFGTGVVMGGGHLPLSESIAMITGSFAFVLALALPGFILMRLALYWTHRKDWFSFAIAGGLNGVATIGVMQVFDWMGGGGPRRWIAMGHVCVLCRIGCFGRVCLLGR
jgi:hypothetical protein